MGRFLAQIILLEAVFLIPGLVISVGYGEISAIYGFLITLAILLVLGAPMAALCRNAGSRFGVREGMVCVSLSWLIMSLLAHCPSSCPEPFPPMWTPFSRQPPASPPQAHPSCRMWKVSLRDLCSGEALPTGSAVWVCWYSCWPSPQEKTAQASPCT